MTDPFLIAQGAARPSIAYNFTAGGTAASLSGNTGATFSMRPVDSDTWTVNAAAATVTDAANGAVRYDFATSDTATPGEYRASFSVGFAAGPLISPEFVVVIFARADDGAAARKVLALLDDDGTLFAPSDVDAALAETCSTLYDAPISPTPQRASGTVVWLAYETGYAWLDPAVAIRNAAGGTVSSSRTIDSASGRVVFAADTHGSAYYLTGTVYEPYLAAATLADRLAARYAREYDFASDGASFSRSQRAAAWRSLATDLRSRTASVGVAEVVRLDAATCWDGAE